MDFVEKLKFVITGICKYNVSYIINYNDSRMSAGFSASDEENDKRLK